MQNFLRFLEEKIVSESLYGFKQYIFFTQTAKFRPIYDSQIYNYIQCQRCSRLERFFIGEKILLFWKRAMQKIALYVNRTYDRELQRQRCKFFSQRHG
jgi:hypothetical protein